MKTKRFLFLVMAICLASGVKAQFYDSADDIYYYVRHDVNGYYYALIFNFDGRKACVLASTLASTVQENLKQNSDFYAEKVETTPYDLEYKANLSGTRYIKKEYEQTVDFGGVDRYWDRTITYDFSTDRKTVVETVINKVTGSEYPYSQTIKGGPYTYKKVDKNYFLNGFFGVGRQRK